MVEMVLQKRLHRVVTVKEVQFGFMSERGTIDDVFILRRLQDEHLDNGKCCMDVERSFHRVPRKVLEWAMRKKGIP